MEQVGQRKRHRYQHVGVGLLVHHLADVGGSPLPQELLRRQLGLVVRGQRIVEGGQVIVEQQTRVPERVFRVEVEDVRHAVEDEGIVDHGRYSFGCVRAAMYASRSGTSAGGGRKRRMSRARGERRSVVHASSQTIDTSASVTPGWPR